MAPRVRLTLTLVLISVNFSIAESPLVIWDFDRLVNESDVIAIVTVANTAQQGRVEKAPSGLVEVKTEMQIVASIKGSISPKAILYHHILDQEVGSMRRNPILSFEDIATASHTTPKREGMVAHYLVFLKRTPNGTSEFVLTSGPSKEVSSVSFLRFDRVPVDHFTRDRNFEE